MDIQGNTYHVTLIHRHFENVTPSWLLHDGWHTWKSQSQTTNNSDPCDPHKPHYRFAVLRNPDHLCRLRCCIASRGFGDCALPNKGLVALPARHARGVASACLTALPCSESGPLMEIDPRSQKASLHTCRIPNPLIERMAQKRSATYNLIHRRRLRQYRSGRICSLGYDGIIRIYCRLKLVSVDAFYCIDTMTDQRFTLNSTMNRYLNERKSCYPMFCGIATVYRKSTPVGLNQI